MPIRSLGKITVNVFFEGAILMFVALLFVAIWLGVTLDEGDLLPPGWYVMPAALIGMLLVTGALV